MQLDNKTQYNTIPGLLSDTLSLIDLVEVIFFLQNVYTIFGLISAKLISVVLYYGSYSKLKYL